MVDREERVIELKEEVNRLAREAGRDAPSPPVRDDEEALHGPETSAEEHGRVE